MLSIKGKTWVPVKSIKQLKVGMNIRSCRNGNTIEDFSYTGIIESMTLHPITYTNIDIRRDDGHNGGGVNGTWNTYFEGRDLAGYEILEEPDWDA